MIILLFRPTEDMEGFQCDRVYDRVVIQVAKYNEELRRWSVGFLLVFLISAGALFSWTGIIVLLFTDWFLFIGIVWWWTIRTHADDDVEILKQPARAAFYGFLLMQHAISLELVSSRETPFWLDMVKRYSDFNTQEQLLDMPNPERLENLMAQEVIRKLRTNTILRKLKDNKTHA